MLRLTDSQIIIFVSSIPKQFFKILTFRQSLRVLKLRISHITVTQNGWFLRFDEIQLLRRALVFIICFHGPYFIWFFLCRRMSTSSTLWKENVTLSGKQIIEYLHLAGPKLKHSRLFSPKLVVFPPHLDVFLICIHTYLYMYMCTNTTRAKFISKLGACF